MPLPRPASPRALWTDMAAFWRYRPRHQWVAAVLALLDSGRHRHRLLHRQRHQSHPAPDDHDGRESGRRNRTDEQIRADQNRRQAEARPPRQRAPGAVPQDGRRAEPAGDLSDRALDGGGDRARRARPRPHRAQSACRLPDRQGRGRRRPRLDPAGRPAACRGGGAGRGRRGGARRDRLCDAGALRA